MMSNQRPGARPRSADDALAPDPLGALRTRDRDRFLQVLLAPSAARPALLALCHFNLELAQIADHVREPMAGLIRLQWWRDAVAGLEAGTVTPHPVITAMAESDLAGRLGIEALGGLIDAREVELDATPLKRIDDLEAHAAATAGALNGLVAHVLGAGDQAEPARTAGTAYGLLGIVRAVPFVMRRPQPLLPAEPLAAHGLAPDRLGGGAERLDALRPVLADITARAAARLEEVPARAGRRVGAALVLRVLARQDLARLRRREFDIFDGRLAERPPWTAARCLIATTLGRFG